MSDDDRDFEERQERASDIRELISEDAEDSFITSLPPTNGDEQKFRQIGFEGFASFTKALSHNLIGLVEKTSFESLLTAIQKGTQIGFEQVQLGGGIRKLVNPLNAYSFQLIGDDSNGARMASAPSFASRNTAVDMVERYWMALSRDIPFDRYDENPLIAEACEDLNQLGFEQEFGFTCTPNTIFRGSYDGCDVGPHVSQFLLQNFQFGNQPIAQLQNYPRENLDYLTDIDTWKQVNNGDIDPTDSDTIEGTRHIITLRDAGQWVHIDLPFQSGLWATLILFQLNAKISNTSPYANGQINTSEAFGSFGAPDIGIQSGLAAVYGLKHAWFQKWCVHRRLRPEVYAQRLELFRRGDLGNSPDRPFDDQLFNQLFGEGAQVWRETRVLDRIFEYNQQQNSTYNRGDRNGTWLLPIAFPEGSPTHPAYPGGHSAFIAAAATILKAFFADEVFPEPKIPISNGQQLDNYVGPTLTVHGELNKLIANITLFRDGAGMHWRTDGTALGPNNSYDRSPTGLETGGNLLGEKMAVSMLRDVKRTYREVVGSFEFQSISGKKISI
ncbi:MAG: phosphatidic acid phosphatase [Prochloraceae cyanobacterium]|nr:phosphatidic acid phosphatase [Prochloraceae cyanobacterium]